MSAQPSRDLSSFEREIDSDKLPTGTHRFDPLRLGTTKPRFEWFKEGELTNGRCDLQAWDARTVFLRWLFSCHKHSNLRHLQLAHSFNLTSIICRWAMLAVAGILFTEFFGIAQPWWDLGNKVCSGCQQTVYNCSHRQIACSSCCYNVAPACACGVPMLTCCIGVNFGDIQHVAVQ